MFLVGIVGMAKVVIRLRCLGQFRWHRFLAKAATPGVMTATRGLGPAQIVVQLTNPIWCPLLSRLLRRRGLLLGTGPREDSQALADDREFGAVLIADQGTQMVKTVTDSGRFSPWL